MESTTNLTAKTKISSWHIVRFIEWLALFFGVPVVVAQGWVPFNKLLLLVIVTVLCLVYLLLNKSFDPWRLGGLSRIKMIWKPFVVRVALCSALLFLFCWVLYPEYLFSFIKRSPKFWVVVFFFYPVVSAWPQELIYRAFMFQRYQKVFNRPKIMICASAAAFSFLHIIYINPVALTLTFIGGLIFAWDYHKTGHLGPSFVEHAIYGNLVFTLGLGMFFFRSL